jgi:conjugative relaxase-like TrwC/TraI family protein
MITVSQIRGGKNYMERHLSSNDYYSENETVVGQWMGKSADLLGIKDQAVTNQSFTALATNRHPKNGEKLRPRDSKVSFHDFVISAPKSVSVAALVGGDERLREAYDQCVEKAFSRMESFAARRERKGEFHGTEQCVRTGESIAAVFKHDTSRLLDPQLHTHMVFANVTWDQDQGQWFALQPKFMAEQSSEWIRDRFYRELEKQCQHLGYRTQRDHVGFRLLNMPKGVETAMSQRTHQRKQFEARYQELFRHSPSKKRVEWFIKDRKAAAQKRFREEYEARFGAKPSTKLVSEFVVDWRSDKMQTSSQEQVAQVRQERLTEAHQRRITEMVTQARNGRAQAVKTKMGPVIKIDEEKITKAPTPAKKRREEIRRKTKVRKQKKVRVETRADKIRRLKRGASAMRALHGHPASLLAAQIRSAAKNRNEAKRRV